MLVNSLSKLSQYFPNFRQNLRLWRTLFIHRWHAPQTIGEQCKRPSVGMRFEQINHADSLSEYIWRYGAFRENSDGTGREDVSTKPSRKYGLEAVVQELHSKDSRLMHYAIEYAILTYGNPTKQDYDDALVPRLQELHKLASRHPAIKTFASKLVQLHRSMLQFYVQMRYLTKSEADQLSKNRIPLVTSLRPTNYTAGRLLISNDSTSLEGDPILLLRKAFFQNIYNALCWRARSELILTTATDPYSDDRGIKSIVILDNRVYRFSVFRDKALAATLISLNEASFSQLFRILAAIKTAVSTMITAMPMFIIKNFFRDTLAGFVAGRYWQIPFLGTVSGGLRAAKDLVNGNDELVRDYLLQGGFYSGLVEAEVRVGETERVVPVDIRTAKIRGMLKRVIFWFTRPAWIAEAGTRLDQYQRARDQGATKYEAIRAARMVSADFANIGASRAWRMYVHTVPFLNAAIQGFDQLYQICRPEWADKKSKKRWGNERKEHVRKTLISGACLAGMAWGVWLWNTDDYTRRQQYLSETEYEKAAFLTIYDVFDSTDIRIPVPFQIGAAFMKIPEIGIDLTTGTDTLAGVKFTWSLIHGNLALGWLPAAIQPVWEVTTNRNFFGAPIIPGYMQNWPPERQYFYRSTPKPLVLAGDILGVSPLVLQTYVRGWTGHLGRLTVAALDDALWDTNRFGAKPFPRTFGYATGLASVLVPKANTRSRWSEEYYKLANRAAGMSRGQSSVSKSVRKKQRSIFSMNMNFGMNKKVRKKQRKEIGTKEKLSRLRKQIDQVREHRGLSRVSKEARIIKLYAKMDEEYRQALPTLRRLYDN